MAQTSGLCFWLVCCRDAQTGGLRHTPLIRGQNMFVQFAEVPVDRATGSTLHPGTPLRCVSPHSTNPVPAVILRAMVQAHSPLDSLWSEYRDVFRHWDDLTLARWLAQTLGQFEGRAWRMSHPLMGAYRLAAQLAHDRQIWFKRLATPPIAYTESPCCRAPMLPLLTRDVLESGLICPHCDEPMLPATELPEECRPGVLEWAREYAPVHAVAHWDDRQRKASGDYDHAFENAARDAEALLARAGTEVATLLLDHYPAVVWEDQDECLEVRPEDVKP